MELADELGHEEEELTSTAVLEAPIAPPAPPSVGFRLRPIMRQGTASSVAETWVRYNSLDEARRAVKQMYHDDRVLRVFVVTDEAPPRFAEWIER